MTTIHFSVGGLVAACGLSLTRVFEGEAPSYTDRLSEVNCAHCLGNPRPKERALLDAISKLSRASSDLGSGVPPLFGGRAALVRRWTEAYEDLTRMVVELELDARTSVV